MEENNNVVTTPKEGSKFGWGVLGFFFPLVGLILFLVWLKNKKKASKAAGIGALIGFILQIAVVVLSFMGVVSIFGFLGEPVIDNKDDSGKKTAEVIEDDTEEEVDLSDPCNVKATMSNKSYLYNFDYDETCETVSVLDDSNKVLFKVKDNKAVFNNGVEYDLDDYSYYKANNIKYAFFKVDSSIVLYRRVEPYTSLYVYNTKDSTGFEITPPPSGEDIVSPEIREVESDGEKILKITVMNNDAKYLDPSSTNPRVIVYNKIRSCEVTDIDELLTELGIEAFSIEKTYTYKSVDGKISNNPTVEVTKTIKDYFHSYDTICNR